MAHGGTRSTGRPRALPASRTQSHQRRFSTCFFAYPPLRGEIEFPPWPEPQRGNPLYRKVTLRRCKERRQEYSRAGVSFTSAGVQCHRRSLAKMYVSRNTSTCAASIAATSAGKYCSPFLSSVRRLPPTYSGTLQLGAEYCVTPIHSGPVEVYWAGLRASADFNAASASAMARVSAALASSMQGCLTWLAWWHLSMATEESALALAIFTAWRFWLLGE